MENTAGTILEALYLWANDSRTLKELRAGCLEMCDKGGIVGVEKGMKFLDDLFIPEVKKSVKSELPRIIVLHGNTVQAAGGVKR